MTTNDTVKFLDAMQSIYQSYNPKDKAITLKMWSSLFADIDLDIMLKALQTYAVTDESGFAPTIGAINKIIYEQYSNNSLTDAEAWAMVHRIIKEDSFGDSEKLWEELPNDVKRAVGSYGVLEDWMFLTIDRIDIIRSQFLKTYREVKQQRIMKERSNTAQLVGSNVKMIGAPK